MHHPIRTYCTMLALLLVCAFSATLAGAAPTDSQEEALLFGFYDKSGYRILVLGGGQTPFAMKKPQAILPLNQNLPVTYETTQTREAGSSGRQTAANFDRLAGHVLRSQAPGIPNQSVLLAEDTFWADRQLISGEKAQPPLAPLQLQQIEALRQRAVEQTWGLLQANDGTQLHLVLFQRDGDQALASLVLLLPDRILFRDFPATYRGNSTWRVDDGGLILPIQFRILYLGRIKGRVELAYEFLGAEGILIDFVTEDKGFLVQTARASRYTSPF